MERVEVLPSIAMLCLLVLALVADWSGMWSRPLKPIGAVENLGGVVRRLPRAEMTWDYVWRTTPVEPQDAVLTDDASTAIVQLRTADGESVRVEIQPQTMFVVGGELEGLDLPTLEAKLRARGAKIRNPSTPKSLAQTASVATSSLGTSLASSEVQPLRIARTERGYLSLGAFDFSKRYPEISEAVTPASEFEWNPLAQRRLELRWRPTAEGMYEVTLRQRNRAQRHTHVVTAPVLALERLAPGNYEWNVRGVNQAGLRGPASEWRSFRVLELVRERVRDSVRPKNATASPAQLAPPKVLPVRIRSSSFPSPKGGAP